MEVYKIRNLNFTYPDSEIKALNDITLDIGQGDFVVVCGKSGCGKTTLLRHLKSALTPYGEKTGEILFCGEPLEEVGQALQTGRIGFVSQTPDNQIVTDKVWHELAFGLESLGVDNQTIRLRVAEMASFFGIESWFYRDVSTLSGGQKQLLNLASVMTMLPHVLVLDEPTSQLDPIAASEFLGTVKKINRELGVTIVLSEHRLEEAFPMADAVLVMEEGGAFSFAPPAETGEALGRTQNDMLCALPSAMQIYLGVGATGEKCPVTVRDGRRFIDEILPEGLNFAPQAEKSGAEDHDWAVELDEVWFKYEKNGPDILKGLSLKIPRGGLFALLGGNGVGKTTVLSVVSGIEKAYRGKVRLNGKPVEKYGGELFDGFLGVLPQNPQALFVKKTVGLDLFEALRDKPYSKDEREVKIDAVTSLVDIKPLLHKHPYDISGGEQQRAALAKVLLLDPKILLLDEPTKGLDSFFKEKLSEILKRLMGGGVTVLMVSHDIEFCAKYADRCALMFGGGIISEGTPRAFFGGNNFYTTSANRIARHRCPDAITNEDVISLCKVLSSRN